MVKDCHVGIKGLVCVDRSCLVLQKGAGDTAYWDVPGGRIDGDETIEETLFRELREELPSIGTFSLKEIVGAYRLKEDLEGDRGLVFIFYRVKAEQFEVTLSLEHVDYKWVSKENLAELRGLGVVINPELYSLIERVLET